MADEEAPGVAAAVIEERFRNMQMKQGEIESSESGRGKRTNYPPPPPFFPPIGSAWL